MDNGKWIMENGEWRMENGEWRMGSWKTGDGRSMGLEESGSGSSCYDYYDHQ
ncbi:MAG: hypothetical protein JXB49_36800 [Bacteroidales bacterium]|nr:hypothetical protein [Bacteroidales bacterium]